MSTETMKDAAKGPCMAYIRFDLGALKRVLPEGLIPCAVTQTMTDRVHGEFRVYVLGSDIAPVPCASAVPELGKDARP